MNETKTEGKNGRDLKSLHTRLRIVEIVVFISLMLSLIQGYIANQSDKKLQNQIDVAAPASRVP